MGDFRAGKGFQLSADAAMSQDLSATGNSLQSFLSNLKATDGLIDGLINPIISAVDDIAIKILDMVGVDVRSPCQVEGTMTIKVGVGVGGAVSLGWKDSEGYNMVGAGGGVAAGLHLTLSLFAGLREKRNVKVIIDATNFSIVARIAMPPSEEASQSASLAAGDT